MDERQRIGRSLAFVRGPLITSDRPFRPLRTSPHDQLSRSLGRAPSRSRPQHPPQPPAQVCHVGAQRPSEGESFPLILRSQTGSSRRSWTPLVSMATSKCSSHSEPAKRTSARSSRQRDGSTTAGKKQCQRHLKTMFGKALVTKHHQTWDSSQTWVS